MELLMHSQERAIPTHSLIEYGELPLGEIAALAIREGRRPRAIYTAHKWFARRLGTVFRSLLVGAVSTPNDDFWGKYYGEANLQGIHVLDPFVGGGTSVVEAGRLGASVMATDVDPVACAITNLELMAADLPDLHAALRDLQERIGQRLDPYHRFIGSDGTIYKVLHHFWVQVVTCARCNTDFDAHPNFQLAFDAKQQWVFCSHCGTIDVRKTGQSSFRCGECKKRTIVMQGRVDFGKATCPFCAHKEPLIEVGRRTQIRPRWRQFAVEVLAKPDGARAVPLKHRLFFRANEQLLGSFQEAERIYHYQRETNPELVPVHMISNIDRFDSRLIDYGYRAWTDLFNSRQLLHLSWLADAINSYPEPLRTALSMAFSDHLTTNCMMTSYASGWRRLTPLFSIRAFRHIPRPIELNPWVDKSGRGSFPNAVRKLMRAANYARRPQEPLFVGGFKSVPSITAEKPAQIHCRSARDLSFLDDSSVDVVLTDPPYFDNIVYSELAEFFLPWLQHLKIVATGTTTEHIKLESLVGSRDNVETIEQYKQGLTAVFGELTRVLKPEGLIMFSYRHILPEAWSALASAILPHPLSIVRVLPMPGEAGMGLHAHAGTGFWDAVFILRRGVGSPYSTQRQLLLTSDNCRDAERSAEQWVEKLQNTPLAFTHVDRATIRRALLVGAALVLPHDTTGSETSSLEQALSWVV